MGFAGSNISIPGHLKGPGQDGYRTPTIEDVYHYHYGHHFRAQHDHDTPMLLQACERAQLTDRRSVISNGSTFSNKSDRSLLHIKRGTKLAWKQRIKHFTWTYFSLNMATGGMANVIYQMPLRFHGLTAIGYTFMVINIVLFLIALAMISLRFHFFPKTFKASFLHPTESLFIPAVIVSLGLIQLNISQYVLKPGTPYIYTAANILFWSQAFLAITTSSGIYVMMWSTQTFTIATMTPIWIFPAYPLLIMAPHTATLASKLAPGEALAIIVGGFTLQGVGFLVAFCVYAAFIYRLMTQKLPPAALRPGMFVSVGPAAFTAAGIINIATQAQKHFPSSSFMGNAGQQQIAGLVLQIMANWTALWLWGLAIWFFIISCGAHWSCIGHRGGLRFGMTWYSFIFPNAAMCTSTFAVGRVFHSKAIEIVGVVITGGLACLWILFAYWLVVAIWKRDILWPQKGEDKCEGGFRCGNSDCETCIGGRKGPRGKAWVGDDAAIVRDVQREKEKQLESEGTNTLLSPAEDEELRQEVKQDV